MTTPDQANYQIPEWEDRKDSKKPRLSKKARLVGGAVAGLIGAGTALGLGGVAKSQGDEPGPDKTPPVATSTYDPPEPSVSQGPEQTPEPELTPTLTQQEVEAFADMELAEFQKQDADKRVAYCFSDPLQDFYVGSSIWYKSSGHESDNVKPITDNSTYEEVAIFNAAMRKASLYEHYRLDESGNPVDVRELSDTERYKIMNCVYYNGDSDKAKGAQELLEAVIKSDNYGHAPGEYGFTYKNGFEVPIDGSESYTENGLLMQDATTYSPELNETSQKTYVIVDIVLRDGTKMSVPMSNA